MTDKKFQNQKSHDCHVIMTQLLPVALRGVSTGKCSSTHCEAMCILNAISQKVIDQESLQRLQRDVVQCLVSFELVFPPSFFTSPGSSSWRDCDSRYCISTQYVPLREVHGSLEEICS